MFIIFNIYNFKTRGPNYLFKYMVALNMLTFPKTLLSWPICGYFNIDN